MGKFFVGALLLVGINTATFAADITGLWQTIDDKTGTPKAHVEIRKEANGTYAGKIVKLHRAQVIHQKKFVITALHLIPISLF